MTTTEATTMGGAVPPTYDATANEEPLSLSWRHPKGLFNLSITNFVLRLVTLGIYHFWAKTEVRKRLWSGIRINDEPLIYTGRGMELFLGFVIVAFLVLLPASLGMAGLIFAFGPESPAASAGIFVLYVIFFFLFGVAIYRAMRYRLARTRWRGIRASLMGSPMAYAWTHFWTMLLVPFTLGWIVPWRTVKLQRIITDNMRFGDRHLKFTATPGRLYGPFALLWVGSITLYVAIVGGIAAVVGLKAHRAQQLGVPYMPSAMDIAVIAGISIIALFLFALVGAWYQARVTNHFANHTHFANATFRGNLTAGGLIWLSLTNLLILLAGAALVFAVAAAVVLPFVGIDFQDFRMVQSTSALQVVGTVVPIILLLSLGLLAPIVQARSLGYMIRHMSIEGTAPLADIIQAAGPDVKFGEGLAEAFDVDAF